MMNENKPIKIFFSGIGGSGVSALAVFASDRGFDVSGSDRAFDGDPNHPVLKMLLSKGVAIVPQDGSGIDRSTDFVVMSTAVEADRPEVIKANALGIRIKTRPQYLEELVAEFKSIAVAGTSGKSTASGMLAFLMKRIGMGPNFIGGGRVKAFKTEKNPGNSITGASEWLIAEACESDGTIVNYRPYASIILNLDLDHHGIDETMNMFKRLAENTSGRVIVNADDRRLEGFHGVGFSLERDSRYRAEDVRLSPFGSSFTVSGVEFRLNVPGIYNVYNAMSAIAMLAEEGVLLNDIALCLPDFDGIERRFDVHLNSGGCIVIDDYAHNPHKISSLMKAASKTKESLRYIFQPHGFAPTRMMKQEYINAFAEGLRPSDRLALLPIFYAGGTVCMDISSETIADGVRALGRSACACSREDVLDSLDPAEGYVVMGARDETLSDFAEEIARRLSERCGFSANRVYL